MAESGNKVITCCPYQQSLSKACDGGSSHHDTCLKLDQEETREVLDNVLIHFGKTSRVPALSPNQEGKEICNCFSSWFKNNNKTFLWDSDLKKAFGADSNIPFQTATSTNCKIDTSSALFNSFKEFVNSPSKFHHRIVMSLKQESGSVNSSEEMVHLKMHSKIIEDLKGCWKKRHQIRPFPDTTISWIITLLKEWRIPFKNLFENHRVESCKDDFNPKIFVGFKKRDVNTYFRNCIMTALHSIILFKIPSVSCILGDEQYVYVIKIDYKKSLKKTLLSIFKYSMYNNWNHQCSLYLHLYKLFDSYLPTNCSISVFEESASIASSLHSTTNSDANKPSTCSSTNLENSQQSITADSNSSEALPPKIQAIKQRTEEILRTIQHQSR